ncbi:hypothetical protein BKA62DRAFT_687531 [Auriculariales sp. MPI-PUGE-AT-0066]|nr:hypothetical protein BKA62DRAFT_687531 [Auriculariales sp. MPI-PUGE-AT-0066]
MRPASAFISMLNPLSWFTDQDIYLPPPPVQCQLRAWVRAQDLAPNAVSLGEVRARLLQPCAHNISSITLQLRLQEHLYDERPLEGKMRSRTRTTREAWSSHLAVISSNTNYLPSYNGAALQSIPRDYGASYAITPRYTYSVVANLTDGTSRSAEAGYTTFNPCQHDVASQTADEVVTTTAKFMPRTYELDIEDYPPDPNVVPRGGSVEVLVKFPNGSTVEQGGKLDFEVSLGNTTDLQMPAAEIVVEPYLRSGLHIFDQAAATLFTYDQVDARRELRSSIRPPFPRRRLGESLPSQWTLRVAQASDVGAVPDEYTASRFTMLVDDVFPAYFPGYWGASSAFLRLWLQLGPENIGKMSTITGNYQATFEDAEDGWEIKQSRKNPPSRRDILVFEAKVPITVVHRRCSGTTVPVHYLENAGENAAPVLVRGHEQVEAPEFLVAAPTVQVKEERVWQDDGWRPCTLGMEDEEYLSEIEKHYAGTLWERLQLLGRQNTTRGAPIASETTSASDVEMSTVV